MLLAGEEAAMAMAQSDSNRPTFPASFSRTASCPHPENSASPQLDKPIQTPNYRSVHHLCSPRPSLPPPKTQAAAHLQCAQSGLEVAEDGSRWLKVAPGGSVAVTI